MNTELEVAHGCAVVLVDDRLGDVVPAAAVRLLRGASAVYAESGVSGSLRRELGATEPPAVEELLRQAAREPVVLVAGELSSAESKGLSAAGAPVVSAPAPTGVELLDAVAVMDRLRSPGGCPWDAQQDHRTLRKYLVEETYELLDAIAQRDRGAMREELGDVLLQVLFHARVAAEDEADPFDIDEVAAGLVGKLVSRHPNVFAEDGQVLDAESQHARWEELKQQEKQRDSIVDGVALGQPAVALAAKLVQRASRAGVPVDELDFGGSAGEELFAIAARAKLAGADPEDELRAVALEFAERIRAAGRRAREAGKDPRQLDSAEWRELLTDLPDSGLG